MSVITNELADRLCKGVIVVVAKNEIQLQCRYCGNGGCKRKVIAYLITFTPASRMNEMQESRSEMPICGKASVDLQNSFREFGNENSVGQLLSLRYI